MSGEYSIFTPPDDTGRPLTVVIADDQALVRGGFRLILKAAGINVVAEAADGAQAVAVTFDPHPEQLLRPAQAPLLLTPLAERWRPLRGVAALLLWTYYRAVKKRDAVPIPPTPPAT